MISSKAKHPNCMYMWMNWIVSPKANAEVAEYFGEAPAQSLACEHTEATKAFLRQIPRRTTRRSGSGSTTGRPRSLNAATAKTTARTTTTGSAPGPKSKARRRPAHRRVARWRRLTQLARPEEVGGPQARRPLPRPPPPAGGRPAGRARGLAGDRLPGLAGGPAGHRLLDRQSAQRRGDQGLQPRKLRDR